MGPAHGPHGAQHGQNGQNAFYQPNGNQSWGGPFPSLHLWPIQDTFAMKMIHLPEGQKIKIGRQTNNKTVPGERNAYFDSKVLSRLHAEIWEQGGKIYIRDVKSSNGTFINGDRLSAEGVESEPYDLKSEDMVEFGIDIVSEDNRTIVHHKVAAKVYCCFGPEDAALSAREMPHYQTDARARRQPLAAANPQMPQMNAVMSAGGKAGGLSFDHVLQKLQAELARSKETGAELQTLASSMTDIQDTLGGGLPPTLNGSAAQFIPPQFRSASAEAQAALAGPHGQQAAAFISLQNQLSETQNSLHSHLEKVRNLEDQLQDNGSVRNEIAQIREQMEQSKREMDLMLSAPRGRQFGRRMDDDDDDDDDARSVSTVMGNDDAEERVRTRRRERPDTPEAIPRDGESSVVADLNNRIQTLSREVTEALELSRVLQTQHSEALESVKTLKERVGFLENGISSRVAEEMKKAEKNWDVWRSNIEDAWRKERETWDAERERLRGVVRDWEEASRRAHEEEEERELNERLSDESEDDDEPAGVDIDNLEISSALMSPSRPTSSKVKRRRPSSRTLLAVRALKDTAGSSTPKQALQKLEEPGPRTARPRGSSRKATFKQDLERTGSASTFKAEKESSESGRESGDTLHEDRAVSRSKQGSSSSSLQPIPILTVLVVAAVAGAVYMKSKE